MTTSPRHNWQPKKLNELGFIGRGKSRHRPRNDPSLYGGQYPFFQTGDIKAAELYLTNFEQTYNEVGLAQSKLWKPGTLCITIAANIAENAILGVEGCFPDSVVGFIADPKKANTRFVKYFLDTLKLRMQNVSKGTTQDNLSLDKLLTFDIFTPPVAVQDKIAGVLSAYDDLIANNTRRIAVLEEMAQSHYREWFVRFRFPGHEQAQFIETEQGRVPKGWETKSLRAITSKIGSGATPRGGKEAYKESGISLFRSLNVYDFRFETADLAFIDDKQAAELDNVVVQKHDILLNITGASVARCCMTPSYLLPARVNQHVAIIRADPSKADPYFVFNAINSPCYKDQLLAYAQGGATREALTKDTISNFTLLFPPQPLMKQFGDVAKACSEQRELLHRKNENLRRTRDLLLPKLISGEVNVEHLDIDTGEPVAEVTT